MFIIPPEIRFRLLISYVYRRKPSPSSGSPPPSPPSPLYLDIIFVHHSRIQHTSKMPYELSETKKVGIGLIGFGILFTLFGVILFLDRGLLALGNVLSLSGIEILLGWKSTVQLFTKKANFKGSVPFLVGLFLIFTRWPILGISLEIYGSVVLFSHFWPSIKAVFYQIPVVGWILQFLFR